MKAQLKHAFMWGQALRLYVFAAIVVMTAFFALFIGLFPSTPLRVTAVSLGGVAIAAMFAVNIEGDVSICRRLFSAPQAYMLALTPHPRKKPLAASLIAMAVMDIVTLFAVIFFEVALSFSLTGIPVSDMLRDAAAALGNNLLPALGTALLLLFGYLYIVLVILFCVSAKKSFLFKAPVSGLLAALLGAAVVYITLGVLPAVLLPFGEIERVGVIFNLYLTGAGCALYILLIEIGRASCRERVLLRV
jgi:hypothetical protein